LAERLLEPLETYYRTPSSTPIRQDAIVVFVDPLKVQPHTNRPTITGTTNTDRLLCALVYLHAGSAAKVILAGGASGEDVEALQEWAVLLGYPRDTLVANAQTDATHDRARAVRHLLEPDSRILLVDAALHLPRSAAAFAKTGFTVTPIPCDYKMSTGSLHLSDFVPRGENLSASGEAIHEYVGLFAYWLRGFI
jgi:uncharacterized SAM-binding protein YcdF (DUF218 family)